jgi:hypothetical protein
MNAEEFVSYGLAREHLDRGRSGLKQDLLKAFYREDWLIVADIALTLNQAPK